MGNNLLGKSGGAFAKDIGENMVELNIGNGKAVLGAVFFAGRITGKLNPVTHEIPKLANGQRRNKAAGN
ncbi:hypothetical protein SDC9_109548 [bioreactor metagenome]|uniref:Uncharacterized protein n=1 Tax=bioreactor metagenome TaxID=1076179 RepID=A0A645BDE4_9ZZZZ